MKQDILITLQYFAQFSYPPSFDEIYMFLRMRVTREELHRSLIRLERAHTVVKKNIKNEERYTIGGYSILFKKYIDRTRYSNIKISNFKFQIFKKILSKFPQIKLIGISGSLSMMNAKRTDDIDIFIITERNRLWTGRLIAIVLAEVLCVRRRRQSKNTQDRVCLNLFMDERDLTAPKGKRTEYVAHEVLQMKPMVEKNRVYEKFLQANTWVFDTFPNALDIVRLGKKHRFVVRRSWFVVFRKIGNVFEKLFKFIQKIPIKQHQTTELITAHQLWFHPDDFQKKVREV